MSQNHICLPSVAGDIRLIAGYDRPLQQLFFSIEPLDGIEAGSLSNEHEDFWEEVAVLSMAPCSSVSQLAGNLEHLGIRPPASVLAAVEDDARCQAGNTIRWFAADGSLEREHRA